MTKDQVTRREKGYAIVVLVAPAASAAEIQPLTFRIKPVAALAQTVIDRMTHGPIGGDGDHRARRNRGSPGHRRRARACAASTVIFFSGGRAAGFGSFHCGLSDDAEWTQVEIGLVLVDRGLSA